MDLQPPNGPWETLNLHFKLPCKKSEQTRGQRLHQVVSFFHGSQIPLPAVQLRHLEAGCKHFHIWFWKVDSLDDEDLPPFLMTKGRGGRVDKNSQIYDVAFNLVKWYLAILVSEVTSVTYLKVDPETSDWNNKDNFYLIFSG